MKKQLENKLNEVLKGVEMECKLVLDINKAKYVPILATTNNYIPLCDGHICIETRNGILVPKFVGTLVQLKENLNEYNVAFDTVKGITRRCNEILRNQ